MTEAEAKAYLESITPQPVSMITLDPAVWDDFKTSMIGFLNDPTLDPKYKKAVEDINTIADSALG